MSKRYRMPWPLTGAAYCSCSCFDSSQCCPPRPAAAAAPLTTCACLFTRSSNKPVLVSSVLHVRDCLDAHASGVNYSAVWQHFCDALNTDVMEQLSDGRQTPYICRTMTLHAQHPLIAATEPTTTILVPGYYDTVWQNVKANIGRLGESGGRVEAHAALANNVETAPPNVVHSSMRTVERQTPAGAREAIVVAGCWKQQKSEQVVWKQKHIQQFLFPGFVFFSVFFVCAINEPA